MDHSVDLLLLLIDFCLNSIVFNYRHVVFAVIFITVYGFVNLTVTLQTGTPVYKILTWQDIQSLYFSIAFVVATIGLFLIYSVISVTKNKKAFVERR
jgi:hypothetical protein